MLLSIIRCLDYRHFKNQAPGAVKSKVCEAKPLSQKTLINKEVELISVLGPNISNMRNRAGNASQGEWLFFMDDDCHINTGKILDLVMKIKSPSLPFVCIGGLYHSQKTNCLQKVYHNIQRKWVLRGLSRKSIGGFKLANHLLGGALLVKKTAFKKVGGFNESIGWGSEELDFVHRLNREGFKTGVSFRLIVTHNNSLNLSGFLKRAWFQNFNRAYYGLMKNKKAEFGYLKTPIHFFLPTLLFFSFGLLAQFSGQITRLSTKTLGAEATKWKYHP